MIKKALILSGALTALHAYSNENVQLCETSWDKLLAKHDSYTELLSSWKNLDNQCKDTGRYYHYLSLLQISLNDFESAISSINLGLKKYPDSEEDLMIDIGDLHMKLGVKTSGQVRQENYKRSEQAYLKVIETNENSWQAFAQLSGLKLIMGDDLSVIKFAEKSNSIHENFTSYRNLIISQQRMENSDIALNAAQRLDDLGALESIYGDKDAMLSIALAYSSQEKFKLALGVLRKLVNSNSSVKSDPEFIRVVKVIKGATINSVN